MSESQIVQEILEKLKKMRAGREKEELQYIVYIDDEAELLEPFSEIAQSFGFKCHAVTSAESALKFVEKYSHKIAYIFSDYSMTALSGFEFREKILPLVPEIPFCILSGNITKEIALKGIDLKISGFLSKPINPEKFAEAFNKDGTNRVASIYEDQEMLLGFIEEAEVNIEQAEALALAFENDPHDLESVNKCFGLVHTLKGSSGYLKPKTLHQFIHRFEDLLKAVQRGETKISPEVVNAMLKSFDFAKILLKEFRTRDHLNHDLPAIFRDFFEISVIQTTGSVGPDSQALTETSPKGGAKEPINELRVPVVVLDQFMQASGEMTVIRNMINKCVKSIEAQFPGNRDTAMLSELLEELHEINGGVQSQITNLRKIPVHNILKPIHRAVRDVSKALQKSVELIAVGDDLAVDTAIAGVLNNTLIHLIRNSLDHGIEPPKDRELSGKNPKGKVIISCSQKNETIKITIEDDGRGINGDSIRKKLVKNGSHNEKQASELSSQELNLMIFESGFSTAESVTDISGRGVGMSMVKDSVKSAGGLIEIESIPGKGSKFILTLPVPKSVLIRDCLFISSRGMQFGIPQDDVLRVMRLSRTDHETLFQFQQKQIVEYNDHLVSVVGLSDLLHLKPADIAQGDTMDIVVLGAGKRTMALNVDSILDIEDTVIKPLQGPSKKIEAFQGAAYMGDGTIGLILSAEGLLNRAGITTINNDEPKNNPETQKIGPKEVADTIDVLLFEVGDNSLYAIPNHSIYRIEDFDRKSIQKSAGSSIIPYREKILTLLDLTKILIPNGQKTEIAESDRQQSIVIDWKGHFIGLMVKSINDIAKTEGSIFPTISKQFGIAGTYLIGDKTITAINLEEIIQAYAEAKVINISNPKIADAA